MGNIIDFWHDDISFCPEKCDLKDCFRNSENIRDKTVPHSYFMDIPPDCPKKEGEHAEESNRRVGALRS